MLTTSYPTTANPTGSTPTMVDVCSMDRIYCYNLDINPSTTMNTEFSQ